MPEAIVARNNSHLEEELEELEGLLHEAGALPCGRQLGFGEMGPPVAPKVVRLRSEAAAMSDPWAEKISHNGNMTMLTPQAAGGWK